MRHALLVAFLAAAPMTAAAFGCSGGGDANPSGSDGADAGIDCANVPGVSLDSEPEPRGIQPFESEAELDAYIGGIAARSKAVAEAARQCGRADHVDYVVGSASAQPEDTSIASPAPGVDEGGIVKSVGDALVVLRQGRLYAVDVAGVAPILTDAMRVARTESLDTNVWYDEMFVIGDRVYVVGARNGSRHGYGNVGSISLLGAREIDSFRLQSGKLTRLRSILFESDFNRPLDETLPTLETHASSLAGGKLVLYVQGGVGRSSGALPYPRVFEVADDGMLTVKGALFGPRDVSTSLMRPSHPAFHTVVQCSLPSDGSFDCRARSLLGSALWRAHYASTVAMYFWEYRHLYRFDFSSLDVGVHETAGGWRNLRAFRETSDALLIASTVPKNPQAPLGEVVAALERIPIAAFGKASSLAPASATLLSPDAPGRLVTSRFVGDRLVVAFEPGNWEAVSRWGQTNGPNGELLVVDPATGAVQRAPRPNVTRLEPIGSDRVLVVSTDAQPGLTLHTYALVDPSTPLGTVSLAGAPAEGEGRTHRVVFAPSQGGGTIGYGLVSPPGAAWNDRIANLAFLGLAPTGALSTDGTLSADAVATPCDAACVDGYANTRPIFVGGRTLSLMGSELAFVTRAEGSVTKGAVVELRMP